MWQFILVLNRLPKYKQMFLGMPCLVLETAVLFNKPPEKRARGKYYKRT